MNSVLEALRRELEAVVMSLDGRQTQLRPASGRDKWNIQQIAGHLRLTYAATSDAMNARITKGTPTRAKASLAQHVGQFTLIHIGYFPKGRKAPDRVTAPASEDATPGSLLMAQITEVLQEMDRRVAAAEVLFGRRDRVISHMVLGPLSIDQWRKFHLVHGRHHIKQIQAIRREHRL